MKDFRTKAAEELSELQTILLKQVNKDKNKPADDKLIGELGDVTAWVRILTEKYGAKRIKEIADLKEIKYRAKYDL